MNGKAIIPLIAGLVIGGFALKLGSDSLKRAQGAQQVESVRVWAAARELRRGDKVDEPALKAVELPKRLVPAWACTDKEKLLGRLAASTTYEGQFFHELSLLPPGARAELPVPPGLRAVSVKIDESSGVDYHLEPGSRVDVVATTMARRGSQQLMRANVIIQDVEVAAVGERTLVDEPAAREDPTTRAGTAASRAVRAVTLFVTPEDALALAVAEQTGRIKLTMRGEQDKMAGKGGGLLGLLLGRRPPSAPSDGWDEPEPAPAPPVPPMPLVAAAPPPAPAAPTFAHRMRVWNGAEYVDYGWMRLDSMQPVRLTDGPVEAVAPAAGSPSSEVAPPAESETEPEPEELLE